MELSEAISPCSHGLVVLARPSEMSEHYQPLIMELLAGESNDPQLAVVHYCGYWAPPTEEDRAALMNELQNDETMGLQGYPGSLILREASQEAVDTMNQAMAS